jgi:hypothetical protein
VQQDNNGAGAVYAHPIRKKDQIARHYVMRKHLPEVLEPRFKKDNDCLSAVIPERDNQIQFHKFAL